jgi:hypothetical protein
MKEFQWGGWEMVAPFDGGKVPGLEGRLKFGGALVSGGLW